MCSYICPLLFHILQLNLKCYMDLLLIWGSIYPQKIILPYSISNYVSNLTLVLHVFTFPLPLLIKNTSPFFGLINYINSSTFIERAYSSNFKILLNIIM